jgi:isovaleryl-CoA dehydrogenase
MPDRYASLREEYALLAESTVARRADSCRQAAVLDRESWQEISDAGIWQIPVPSEYKGQGGTWREFVAAFEGVAAGGRDLGFCLSMVAQAGLIRALLLYGTDTQRSRWLPRLTGGAVGATALTETTGGSDVSRIRTRAVPDGDGYRLEGHKDHITNAPAADIALILGRVPARGPSDITLFMVDLAAEGVTTGPAERMLGNQSSPTGPIALDRVPVAADDVIAGVGEGLSAIYNIISLDRLLYGVLAAAYLDPLLDEVLGYARQRHAFKVPIAEHQYVQGRLTDVKFAVEATRWVSYGALQSLSEQRPDASLLCSVAKYHAGETLRLGTETAMRVYGHLGYMDGPVTHALQDALGTLIAGGTVEMQRKNVFSQMERLLAGAAAGGPHD